MTDEKTTELFIDISKTLGEINAKMTSLCNTIGQHENRISLLEKHVNDSTISNTKEDTFRTELLKLLAKALIISLCTIGTLTGASSLIKTLVGVQ